MLRDPLPFAFSQAATLGVSCRPELESDRPFLLKLYRTTREDELATTDWSEINRALFVQQQFSAQHSEYISSRPALRRLIVQRGALALGRYYLDLPGESCHLVDISLVPEVRGQGIGAALLSDLMAYAALQAKIVTLSVIATNPAKSLYSRIGFKVTDDSGLYHRMAWTPPAQRP